MSPRISGVLLVAAVSAAAGLSPLGGDVRGSLERFATARTLPDGPGRELVTQSCLVCHSAMLITQQRKDSTAWAKTIGLMQTWGAPIPDSIARDSVQMYLVSHFGARERPTATR